MANQFFCYYGGKQNMSKHILPLIPNHKIYIEPFCGGGSVFFAKQPANVSILNDLNSEIINFYKLVAGGGEDLTELLTLVDCSLHSKKMYDESYEIYKNPAIYSPAQRAWAIWFNANNSFGSQILTNFARGIQDGKAKFPTKIKNDKAKFRLLTHKIESATIECEDALHLMRRAPYNIAEMFAYLDPPYFNSYCGHYGGYSEEDFINLLTFLATEFKGKFLLSSYQSEILSEFTANYAWQTKEIKKNLSVTGQGTQGKSKIESLTFNYNIPQNKLF